MSEKSLKDLEPVLTENRLRFICPACAHRHWISIALNKKGQRDKEEPTWSSSGGLDNLIINPSIDGTSGGCRFHGWVQKGKVIWK